MAPSPSPQIQAPQERRASGSPRVRSSGSERNSAIAIGETRSFQQAPAVFDRTFAVRPRLPIPTGPAHAKRPPGNRAAFSLGRIVPTEAKPSELSGCILSLAKTCVKAKTVTLQLIE